MSEDEQCGRWETTPGELKLEVRRLRDTLEKVDKNLQAIIVYAKAGSELERTALGARKLIERERMTARTD
jgi:hypothetical protein